MTLELLEWNDSYRELVPEIDRQHQHLFELLNSLAKAVEGGYDQDIIGDVLVEMAAYADEHFKTEQLYLEKHPDFQKHFLEHWAFTKKCMKLVMAFRNDQAVAGETLEFLMRWLQNHVLKEDMRYFRELAEEGHIFLVRS